MGLKMRHPLLALVFIAALALIAACSSEPTPSGPSAQEIRDIVQEAVQGIPAPAPSGPDADEIRALVQESVDAAVMAIPTAAPTMMGPSGDPVKIGTVLDFTGDLGAFGPPMRNGADLAAELLNEAGGVLGRPVEGVHRDGGTSPQVSTDAARALITAEGVDAIVGPLASGVTQAVASAVTIPNQVVLITPSGTSPAITAMEDDDFLFRTTVSDAAQGVILARLARELGYDTASAIYVNNAYGDGLANVFGDNFEAEGGTIIALVPQESGQATYVSELDNATEDSPDVLVAIGYPESAGVYLREALEGAYIDTFMFVDGTKNQDMFDTLGVENFEGYFGTAPGTQGSDSSAIFRILYEKRYGELPTNPFIAETFDAFTIIGLAIEKAGVNDGEAIRDALREVANPPGIKVGPGDLARAIQLIQLGEDIDYEGVAGSQNFDENGDVLNTIEIWHIVDGQITSSGRFETP